MNAIKKNEKEKHICVFEGTTTSLAGICTIGKHLYDIIKINKVGYTCGMEKIE